LKVITIHINGAARQLAESCSIAALIEELGYTGKRIALERNGDIVPRSQHVTQQINDGDKLEIVVAVGGG
jgi:sulfur carrier protein